MLFQSHSALLPLTFESFAFLPPVDQTRVITTKSIHCFHQTSSSVFTAPESELNADITRWNTCCNFPTLTSYLALDGGNIREEVIFQCYSIRRHRQAFGYSLCEKMATCLAILTGEKGFPSTLWFINRELMHVGWGLSVAAVFASLTRLVFRLSLSVMSCHQSRPNRF